MIRKTGKNKWTIYSKSTGKRLGTFDSLEAANKRLAQIHYFKHRGAQKGSDNK